mmetsp:Transcript_9160/g.17212  ORF Transcript_9160/g.17212 Transcript_9160/m.17212 type:complete len:119 (-) Transcript_9160:205-561(-)|eukprot:CAMPEP_0175072752 /NCGR_PEP_ID=MMETSP0052_2-20121109/20105_1 /TAXON_ID=51329 ORGANISM="Polytomella parva, Strain SAG 63-3" /NCGR_SAMPLE_ID=MMETSP0052_2 /ASSEMBLY_ACC=CAM_ASM_000194 /LENGTH=118 /DNA_ID=CAMNT_0016340333 /DNA_START=82 /DNA_END=438 /DNA_ORIENTATION=+
MSMLSVIRCRMGSISALPMRMALPAGKKGSKDKGPAKVGNLSKEVATGCGVLKGQADPPIRADSEYPSWLWNLLTVQKGKNELEKLYLEEGLSPAELERLWKIELLSVKLQKNNASRK